MKIHSAVGVYSFYLFNSKTCFVIILLHVEMETKIERNSHHIFSFLITVAVFLKFESSFLRKSNLHVRTKFYRIIWMNFWNEKHVGISIRQRRLKTQMTTYKCIAIWHILEILPHLPIHQGAASLTITAKTSYLTENEHLKYWV